MVEVDAVAVIKHNTYMCCAVLHIQVMNERENIMTTFNDLLENTKNIKGNVFRLAFDMNPNSLKNVIGRKFKIKITLEQAEMLCKTADETRNAYNAAV